VEPDGCAYGAERARTIVLFGDSHAGQWFPALERLADARGWRLVPLTKAACAAVDATVWSPVLVRAYTECDQWRSRALTRIAAERPELVIVSNSRAHSLVRDGRPAPVAGHRGVWRTALQRTLRELRRHAGAVAVIGDTPRPNGDPPACLSRHHDDTLACTTPRAEALAVDRAAEERGVAAASGAAYIDPTAWVCPSEPCPVVLGRILVYRDGNHMTATFAAALAARLEGELPLPTG
jgi:hypothetical protein